MMNGLPKVCFISFLFMESLLGWSDSECSRFQAVVIDDSFPGAYQSAFADINNDGKLDIAALGEGASGVFWYENPSWKRRPICTDGLQGFIDFDFYDLDGDGDLEAVIASDFNLGKTDAGGTISWLNRRDDLDQPWSIHFIHAEPTTHRLRWVELEGESHKRLIAAPMAGPGSSGPDFKQSPVRLLAFSIPAESRKEAWRFEVIDHSLHLLHGLMVRSNEIYTASLEGVTQFSWRDKRWIRQTITAGLQDPDNRSGSSEIAAGSWKKGEPFWATIDPWHGNQVAVYAHASAQKERLQRHVIDDSFVAGHALACADFDQDGDDEVIAGFRGEGHCIYYYDFVKDPEELWRRSKISGDVAVQGLAIADVDDDGWLDFIAAGGSTHNVILYKNCGGAHSSSP
ncbi:MAG: VCBS repeat-containing protein [Candidatus Omnitrophica bacterium]|nr:VCBS repeat-containing protein [Candidatus Omnitrophota bacterium]